MNVRFVWKFYIIFKSNQYWFSTLTGEVYKYLPLYKRFFDDVFKVNLETYNDTYGRPNNKYP